MAGPDQHLTHIKAFDLHSQEPHEVGTPVWVREMGVRGEIMRPDHQRMVRLHRDQKPRCEGDPEVCLDDPGQYMINAKLPRPSLSGRFWSEISSPSYGEASRGQFTVHRARNQAGFLQATHTVFSLYHLPRVGAQALGFHGRAGIPKLKSSYEKPFALKISTIF